MAEVVENEPELLPVEKYMRAVSICNNLALLASQGTMVIFIQRIEVLRRIETCWTKGDEAQLLYEHLEEPGDSAAASKVVRHGKELGLTIESEVPGGSDGMTLAMHIVDVKLEPELTSGDQERLTATDDHESDGTIVEDERRATNSGGSDDEEDVKMEDVDEEWKPPARKGGRKIAGKLREKSKRERKPLRAAKSRKEAKEKPRKLQRLRERSETKSRAQAEEEEKAMAAAARAAAAAGGEAAAASSTAAFAFICSICKLSFTTFQEMRDHKLEIHGQVIRDRSSISTEALNIRNLLATQNADVEERICLVCNRVKSKCSLKNHITRNLNEKSFMCSVCGLLRTTARQLKLHMLTHGGERPFTCTDCGKQFIDSSALTMHMRGHTGERPYACDRCDKKYVNATQLKYHMRTHTGERPYSCDVCGQTFIRPDYLRLHQQSHGLNRFSCSDCHMSFTNQKLVYRHRKLHHIVKPHACQVCNKTFAIMFDLKIHMRSHTGEKPYSCQLCNKTFGYRPNFNKHVKSCKI